MRSIRFWQRWRRVLWPLLVCCCGMLVLGASGTLAARAVEAKLDPPAYRQIAAIPIPGAPTNGTWCFDISWVSDGRYFLADPSRRGVDVIDTRRNVYSGILGKGHFAGARGCAQGNYAQLGPEGVVLSPDKLWVGDGTSEVKVFDMTSGALLTSVATGPASMNRADEMAFGDGLVLVTNPDAPIPYVSFIDTRRMAVVATLAFPTRVTLEQPVWDPVTHLFYLNVPAKSGHSGTIAVIDPLTRTVVRSFPLSTCAPNGAALDASRRVLALGCGNSPALLLDPDSGRVLARVPVTGTDMVAADGVRHRFVFAGATQLLVSDETGRPVWSVPTPPATHSVAVEESTGRISVPETSGHVLVYAPRG